MLTPGTVTFIDLKKNCGGVPRLANDSGTIIFASSKGTSSLVAIILMPFILTFHGTGIRTGRPRSILRRPTMPAHARSSSSPASPTSTSRTGPAAPASTRQSCGSGETPYLLVSPPGSGSGPFGSDLFFGSGLFLRIRILLVLWLCKAV